MDLHFPQPPSGIEWSDWRWQLAHAAHDFSTVARYLGVSEDIFSADAATAERYPLLVTPYYLSLAHSPETSDPILRQCLPTQAETNQHVFFSSGYLDVSVPRVRPTFVVAGLLPAGLPHSETRGSTAICASPRLIAACHVLLRL